MRISPGLGLQSSVNHAFDSSRIVPGFPAPTWCNLPKRLGTAVAEALAPEADRLTVHAVVGGDRHLGFASGNGQDNAASQRYLLRSPQGYHLALEFAALVGSRDKRRNGTGHD